MGPLDSGLMNEKNEVFTLLILLKVLKGHLVLQGAPRCSILVFTLGFDRGFDWGFDRGFDRGLDRGFDWEHDPGSEA